MRNAVERGSWQLSQENLLFAFLYVLALGDIIYWQKKPGNHCKQMVDILNNLNITITLDKNIKKSEHCHIFF